MNAISEYRLEKPATPSRSWEDNLQSTNPVPPDDWSQFDINRSLRALRFGKEPDQRLILRKLHLRWWHATASAMARLLKASGVPDLTLGLIPDIV